jgi:hypothetical protein
MRASWWEEKGEESAKCLFAEIKDITQKDSSRLNMLLQYTRLYTGRDNVAVSTQDLISRLRLIQDVQKLVPNGLRYNVVQSTINTLHSKICKRKERVRFLTDGGSWEQQRASQKADRMIYGAFMDARVHEENMKQTLDSYWAGSGFLQVFHKIQNGQIRLCAKRVHPAEIVVSHEDSEDGQPSTLRRIKSVDAEKLIAAYPQYKDRIEHMQTSKSGSYMSYDYASRQVLVAEAWHLPNDDGSGGKHILAIENQILAEEEYTADEYPIIKQDYLWAPIGYYGIGVAELLQGHQREIDELLQYRQLCLKRGSNPRTYVEKSSKVDADQLTNAPNSIVEYMGTMPQQEVRPPYADQLARDIEEIYQKAYMEVGISQLSAASEKPAGLNSGKALREYSDIETERFQTAGQNRQNAHVDIARALIREIKTINKLIKTNPEYKAANKKILSYSKENGLESFDFKDIELLDGDYIIQAHNVSMFPQKPEGQLEYVQELSSAGLITPEDSLELLDFPDTSSLITRRLSGNRYPRMVIEKMLDTGVFISPDPYENHARNFALANEYYSEAKLGNYDEEQLELLRRYMDANDRFMKLAQEASQPPPAPMPAMPMEQIPPEMPIDPNQLPPMPM